MLYSLLRPLLWLLDAERAHRLVLWAMHGLTRMPGATALIAALCGRPDPILRVRAFGKELASPIGLAAGLDKDAEAFAAFAALGFGFVEVGTITAQAQPGNPKPRLFRLPADRALINRMGFNNAGAPAAARKLASSANTAQRGALGINIGKSKIAPADQAIADHVDSARVLAAHADYMVINVSSPNTPGLRDLQSVEVLGPLLSAVRTALDQASPSRRVPLLVKIAPDLADADVDAVADLALSLGLDGILAVNTTLSRAGLHTPAADVERHGAGGLSGVPLKARALEVLRRLRARAGDRLLLVSVGGIESADDVLERLRAGATLVQIYTALIYQGPGLPRRLNRELAARLRAAGCASLADVSMARMAPS
jgi:dihydroorotate dehydrogenase